MSRLVAAEQVQRNARIAADRARGLTWSTLAERYGVSEKQCRNVVKEIRRAAREPVGDDPRESLDDVFAAFDADIEDCALLIESTEHDGVKLGAIRTRAALVDRKSSLMMQVGLLPKIPAWHANLNWTQISEQILQALKDEGIDQDTINEVHERMKRALELRARPPEMQDAA